MANVETENCVKNVYENGKTFDISESIKITEKPTLNNADNNLVV